MLSRSADRRPGPVLLSYCDDVAARVAGACGSRLVACYLHGSAVLGGWVPDRSDVDVLLVVAGSLKPETVTAVAGVLVAAGRRCPGRELECSVVTREQVRRPAPPWPFVLHAGAGPASGGERVVPGAGRGGDPDLLMHYAVCREAGWAVTGPPAAELIGAVARDVILRYLADELDWGIEHAAEEYVVLNACRGLAFAAGGRIVSKVAGGQAALAAGLGPAPLIRRALGRQRGLLPSVPPGSAAVAFARSVAARFRETGG